MHVHIISEHHTVESLCRQALIDNSNRLVFHDGSATVPVNETDLYVWDVDGAGWSFPFIGPHHAWRHFFLIDRATLPVIRERLPFENASILLKPLTTAALAAFLTDACRWCTESDGAGQKAVAGSLRADRDRLLQCLMHANLKLQEYDSDRTNFLARALHDFRAPLTAVTGYCGLLLAGDAGPVTEGQREILQRMQISAKKLSGMASAMFQLSISHRCETAIDLHRGEITECISQAIHEVLPSAKEKRISITADTAACDDPLFFEGSKIEQVLVNLLENSCRFVPAGGAITISGYPWFWERRTSDRPLIPMERRRRDIRQPNCYRIDVSDSGPGIPASSASRLFEEYTSYMGGSDRSGGGLGLAICRMILYQHKGRIWAENRESGAVFSFVLPFHRNECQSISPGMERLMAAGAP